MLSGTQPVESLILPPIRALLKRLPGIRVHPDPYSAPFEAYHHYVTRDQTWDLAAIEAVAAARPGPTLDMGCGSGRLTLMLAAAGHEVTAIDVSEASIARLRQEVRHAGTAIGGRVDILRGDVHDPLLLPTGKFGLAALGDLTINAFATPEALRGLLAVARRVLVEDGVFCFPVLTPEGIEHFARLRGMTAVPFQDDAGRQRLMWVVMRYDQDGPHFGRTLFLQQDTAADGGFAGHVTAVRERLWTPQTLRPHLESAGWRMVASRPLQVPAAERAIPAQLLELAPLLDPQPSPRMT